MSDRLWSYTAYHDRLSSLDHAIEAARERIASGEPSPVEIREHRPASAADIDTRFITDEIWDFLVERLLEMDDMATDEGGVSISPSMFREQDSRPKAWIQLMNAVQSVIIDHADLSDAAWQETGRVKYVTEVSVADGEGGVDPLQDDAERD
jgi:hypothetical protein